ncbi:Pkinase-domain-containing protein [Fomitiporia mediterranea MF3/22]|uniref:Pkinase-domain-containing protein n=1 Tax=Fomitiporia mediterranea (strain MF3/22) TaxID=694068 RepID=UPI0004408CC2|nr:Pkinase-domain-containing protein [Fomitiporia mediterranea MF3/22]EJC98313.1 Pkinase-domain-containing protein [Fomitiporia mediterranea MF3/22]
MSAHVQVQHARDFQPGLATRRTPFANTGNQLPVAAEVAAAVLPQKAHKQPASPPLPRQNTKTAPPSPPQVIRDTAHAVSYSRVGFLGEGGFARVYEVQDRKGQRQAIKVVTKDSLKTKKAKTKLYAEIKIHRSLKHPNIVQFGDCFEDNENVYMTLELCEAGSLMDMLRRRRRFTEPESRFFMVQLIGACHYMHTHQVIHRDLKLGNLFLDAEMNVKVGDFGLAALIENPGERKKTICGTPNYIAPEVLFDTANGHSFEVDTWSIGVILYTLVIGKPPFQTKEVKTIYKRIRDNEYDFPQERPVSLEVQKLIQAILTHDPKQRPTLHDIVDDEFFTNGTVPGYIPRTAHDKAPDFRHISRATSKLNLDRLRRHALLDEDQHPINVPSVSANMSKMSLSGTANASSLNSSAAALAQQEREFQRAVQPSSPISALLGAARQPLVMGAGGNANGREREQPLIRKLQAAQREGRSPGRPLTESRASSLASSATGYVPSRAHTADLQDIEEENEPETKEEAFVRRKELEAQKARIVAQMTSEPATNAMRHAAELEDMENIPPQSRRVASGGAKREPVKDLRSSVQAPVKMHGFDAVAHTLSVAFDAKAKGKLFRDPRADVDLPDAKVFIVSWVDYCNKYGMGYALTDGSVGVHFNDSSSIVMSPDKDHLDYITSKQNGAAYTRKNFTVNQYEEGLKSKVYLLKHFERYIMDRLYGEYPFTFEDVERAKGMDFVQKYLRMKHVIVFKLSNGVLQFNFFDHTKVILSSRGLLVTHINKDYELSRWSLSELMAMALRPVSDPAEAKLVSRLMDKLKYCKEVLNSIKNASGGVGCAEPPSPGSSGDE